MLEIFRKFILKTCNLLLNINCLRSTIRGLKKIPQRTFKRGSTGIWHKMFYTILKSEIGQNLTGILLRNSAVNLVQAIVHWTQLCQQIFCSLDLCTIYQQPPNIHGHPNTIRSQVIHHQKHTHFYDSNWNDRFVYGLGTLRIIKGRAYSIKRTRYLQRSLFLSATI